MRIRANILSFAILLLALLLGLPLLGVMLAGKPISDYTEFPPLTRHVRHAPFCAPVFAALAFIIIAVVAPFVLRVVSCRGRARLADRKRRPFPWWGWVGLLLGASAWFLAWTRFAWFMPLQVFVFSPLWFAYILVVNALTFRRTGRCMIRDRPRFFVLLFPVSAVFWWFFEYLNRFVQNWVYVGIADLSPLQYFIFATLPFSTVLPAVLGTCELLGSFDRLSCGLEHFAPIRVSRNAYAGRGAGWITLLLACAGLMGIGVWPDLLFPMLWVSPLLVLVSMRAVCGQRTILSDLTHGDWRRVWLLALSALACGFFWEMWNVYSLAKWEYMIPYVGRFHVFEMPVLGYTGYLPFGLECGVVAELLQEAVSSGEMRRELTPRTTWQESRTE